MAYQYLQETTSDWKVDYRVPCHIYIMDGAKNVGYIKEGTNEVLMYSKPSAQFSKTRRKFKKLTQKELKALDIIQ